MDYSESSQFGRTLGLSVPLFNSFCDTQKVVSYILGRALHAIHWFCAFVLLLKADVVKSSHWRHLGVGLKLVHRLTVRFCIQQSVRKPACPPTMVHIGWQRAKIYGNCWTVWKLRGRKHHATTFGLPSQYHHILVSARWSITFDDRPCCLGRSEPILCFNLIKFIGSCQNFRVNIGLVLELTDRILRYEAMWRWEEVEPNFLRRLTSCLEWSGLYIMDDHPT